MTYINDGGSTEGRTYACTRAKNQSSDACSPFIASALTPSSAWHFGAVQYTGSALRYALEGAALSGGVSNTLGKNPGTYPFQLSHIVAPGNNSGVIGNEDEVWWTAAVLSAAADLPRAQRRSAGDARLVRAGRVALDGVRHGRGLRRTGRVVQQRVRRDVAAGGEGDVRGASRDGRAVGVQGGGRSGGVQCEPDRGGAAAAGAAEPAGVVGRRADCELIVRLTCKIAPNARLLHALLGAEAGELELLQSEEHPGETVDHLGVAARVCLEHLRVQADCRGKALGLLEALLRIISRRRERERGNGHVVGQASPPSVAVREGRFPPVWHR